jgi:hypothetical protein
LTFRLEARDIITPHHRLPDHFQADNETDHTKSFQKPKESFKYLNRSLLATMPKGKATATVSGRVIAEADEWEFVENNVYVGVCQLPPLCCFLIYV